MLVSKFKKSEENLCVCVMNILTRKDTEMMRNFVLRYLLYVGKSPSMLLVKARNSSI